MPRATTESVQWIDVSFPPIVKIVESASDENH